MVSGQWSVVSGQWSMVDDIVPRAAAVLPGPWRWGTRAGVVQNVQPRLPPGPCLKHKLELLWLKLNKGLGLESALLIPSHHPIPCHPTLSLALYRAHDTGPAGQGTATLVLVFAVCLGGLPCLGSSNKCPSQTMDILFLRHSISFEFIRPSN